jgi:hypothetical protein
MLGSIPIFTQSGPSIKIGLGKVALPLGGEKTNGQRK